MSAPDYRNRTAEQIIAEQIFHDAYGFGFRAVSWLDLAKRTEPPRLVGKPFRKIL